MEEPIIKQESLEEDFSEENWANRASSPVEDGPLQSQKRFLVRKSGERALFHGQLIFDVQFNNAPAGTAPAYC